MVKLLVLVIVCISLPAPFTHAQVDSLFVDNKEEHKRISSYGAVLLTNNAFAPIPAFSFDKPAIISTFSTGRDRFRFEPDFSIGVNGKPWMWNNWFRYNFAILPKLKLYAGVNPTLFFFSRETTADGEFIEAHRNLTSEFSASIHHSEKMKTALTYRYNHAFDIGTISGHFVDVSFEFQRVAVYKDIFLNLRPQLFYFNNEGEVDGFFAGKIIRVGHEKWPLMLAYQAVQSLWSNYLPMATYNHNISLIYLFE